MPGGRRKLGQEVGVFTEDWKVKYMYFEKLAICVICNATIAAVKEYKVWRHYSARHAES